MSEISVVVQVVIVKYSEIKLKVKNLFFFFIGTGSFRFPSLTACLNVNYMERLAKIFLPP